MLSIAPSLKKMSPRLPLDCLLRRRHWRGRLQARRGCIHGGIFPRHLVHLCFEVWIVRKQIVKVIAGEHQNVATAECLHIDCMWNTRERCDFAEYIATPQSYASLPSQDLNGAG